MSDSTTDDDIEQVREQKLEELKQEADAGDQAGSAAAAPDEPIHVEGIDHYRELVDTYDVALVDFYADWCGPCKMIEPIVADLAAETDAAVLKVDIDVHQGLAREMQVQGVPTLYVYSHGEVAERVVGARQKHELQGLIESAA